MQHSFKDGRMLWQAHGAASAPQKSSLGFMRQNTTKYMPCTSNCLGCLCFLFRTYRAGQTV